MRLILASSSVYRRQLLERLCLPFEVLAPDVDESPFPNEHPKQLALRLATAKAQAIAAMHPDAIVIGSDQVATLGSQSLGKPGNHPQAVAQLKQLQGQTVVFHTALCVAQNTQFQTVNVETICRFRALSDEEIENYLAFEQPYDTAGSAKAESLGISLMQSMQSNDPTAIIGLPLIELARLLRERGVNPLLTPIALRTYD
ncbi:Maf family nucleotide pyrophosphatase [Paenalcaligenes hominis]|uniref:7-methyl-GTP pyrophosphatase n=1 Tax=Paenalcaligenes hominis TaxID=643674 RepID=A0ABX0WLZ5_9BURK|nr:Maf family nucleotide pyrophosphatase [Paenalcaligenes hominis]NJB63844.1 septum formation protein [Paenalcaligenes hominis]GGE61054.1 Maf-like protein [Paenalcaligenes hominis]